MESSVGVMTLVPPQTAETVEMPSIEMPLVSYWPPLALACGPFSVGALAAGAGAAGTLVSGERVDAAAGRLGAIADGAGRELGEGEDVTVEGGEVLDVVGGDGAADVRGGGIERWELPRRRR